MSDRVCELCGAGGELVDYGVEPSDESILICTKCQDELALDDDKLDQNHWRCLGDSMWSVEPAVKVMAYRVLKRVNNQELLSMIYLEPEEQEWADDIGEETKSVVVKDSNGTTLEAGDSITIIKDLEVKGAGFTAKRGTVVKNISLNGIDGQIEGRVNGTRIVLLTKFLKKV
jgi:protein PhnA